MENNFKQGDLLVWKPEFLPQKLRYNKSKNKNKHRMVDHFDVACFGKEVQWPTDIFEFVGYGGSRSSCEWPAAIPYIPQRGSYLKLEEREKISIWYDEAVSLDFNEVMLAPQIYGEEVHTLEDIRNLGF